MNGSEISQVDVYLMHNFERQNISYIWNEEDWTFDINVNFSASLYDYGKYTLNVRALDSEVVNLTIFPIPFGLKNLNLTGTEH